MIQYRLNGKVVKVKPEHEQQFLEKYPNAVRVEGNQQGVAQDATATLQTTASASQSGSTSSDLESLSKNANNIYNRLDSVNKTLTNLRSSMDDAKAFNNEALYNSLAEQYNKDVERYKKLDAEYAEASGKYKKEYKRQIETGEKVRSNKEVREEEGFISDILPYIVAPVPTLIAKGLSKTWLGEAWSRGYSQAADTGEAADLIMSAGNVDMETVSKWVKANKDKAENYEESEKMIKFMKKYNSEGRTWTSFFRNLNPLTGGDPALMVELLVQSYATMAGTAIDSPEALAAAGAGAGVGAGATWYTGYGAIGGGIAGAMGGLASSMEASLTLGELIREELEKEGKEFTDENVLALINSEKGISIRNKAVGRGAAIGVVEALTGGAAGRATTTVLKTGAKVAAKSAVKGAGVKLASIATGTGIEAVGGGLGEVAGRVVAGQEMDKAEIGFEAVTGTATAPLNVGYALGTYKKPSYKLNGEIVSYEKMKDFIDTATEEDIAKADIDIQNDLSGLNKNAYEKQNKYYLKSQIDPRVSDQNDIDALVDLEIKLAKLNQKTQSGKNRAKQIKDKIKEITDKYSDVDGRIKEVRDKKKKGAEIKKARQQNRLNATIKFAEEQGKLIGKETIVAENDADAQAIHDKAVEEYNAQNPDDQIKGSDVAGADGFIVGDVIVINKDVAGKTGAINVGAHELLHGIMAKHMKSIGLEGRTKLIADFKNTITKEQFNYIEKRLKSEYKEFIDADANWINQTDEWITIFSDGIKQGDITFNEGIFMKLAQFVQTIARKFGYNKEFQNGRQVYNFLKDYQKSIDKGELSQRAIDLADGGTSVTETAKSISDAKGPIDKLGRVDSDGNDMTEPGIGNFLYQAEADQVVRTIKEKGYLDNLIAAKYKVRPVPEAFVDDVLAELTPHIKAFKPESNDSLFGWIQSQIANKAGTVYKNIYMDKGPARTVDVDATTTEGAPVVQLEADTDTEIIRFEEQDLSKKEVQQRSKLRRDLKLDKPMITRIKQAVIKTFGTMLPDVQAKDFKAALQKAFRTELKKPIQDMMGGRTEYDSFLTNHFEAIYKALPVETLVQMERNLKPERRIFTSSRRITKPSEVDKLISQGRLPKNTNRTSGPQLHTKKPMPSMDKVMAFFRGTDMEANLGYKVGASTLGTRKDKLAMSLAEELAFDATSEVLQDPAVKAKRQGILEMQGVQQSDTDLAQIAEKIDRDPNVKFSFTDKNKNKEAGLYIIKVTKKSGMKLILEYGFENPIRKKLVDYKEDQKAKATDFSVEIKIPNIKYLTTLAKETTAILTDAHNENPLFTPILRNMTANGLKRTFIGTKPLFDKLSGGLESITPDYLSRFLFNSKKKGSQFPTLDKNKTYKKNGKVVNKVGKQELNGKEFYKSERRKLKLLVDFFKWAEGYIKKNPHRAWFFGRVVGDASSNSNSLFRTAATFVGMHIKNGVINYVDQMVEEHSLPQNNVGSLLLNAALGKGPYTVDQVGQILEASFVQLSLLKTDDNKLGADGLDLTNNMPESFWTEVVPRILSGDLKIEYGMASMIRYAMAGVNLNNYFIPALDMTITEYFGVNVDLKGKTQQQIDTIVEKQNALIIDYLKGNITKQEATKQSVSFSKSNANIHKQGAQTRALAMKAESNLVKYSRSGKSKGMSTFDFDETLIIGGKNFVVATHPETGDVIKISSEEWPIKGPDLAAQDYEFDFSDFANVRGGKEGPLLQKMKNQIAKYGNKNVFVLTARQQDSAKPIKEWLKSKGIDIPLRNITGLGKSEGEAKAQWMLQKFAEGYNDMYFVDDALPNVEAVKKVLDNLDIKSKVVQAKVKFSKTASQDFNNMLERSKGVEASLEFSDIDAKLRGAKRDRFKIRFFVPPSAEDLKGLVYAFLGKGEQGNKDLAWFKDNLFNPFAKGIRELNSLRQKMSEEYTALKKQFPNVIKSLNDKVANTEFTVDNAVRVYLWNMAGFEVPGLSDAQKKLLIDHVAKNAELVVFADALSNITRTEEGYVKPADHWIAQNIGSDLHTVAETINRKKFLAEWQENVDLIFSKENLNKIEAIYGSNFREALEDMLYRMKTGSNRPSGRTSVENKFLNWVNGAVSAVMFFNMRSATLQSLSMVNFLNFEDNNVFKAAKAFANQKQFWADFIYLFNSDMLKQRRAGLKIDVSASELTDAFAQGKNKVEAVIKYMLEKGFIPTKMMDSFAIAMGGSTFYRNRVQKYLSEGMSKSEAENQAFLDFQEIAEETQQSSRPDLISMQQASSLGRLILAWANTPMQYTRLTKKALSDIVNGRGDLKANVSRIIYYGAVQNIIFGTLQTGLAFLMFGDDEEDKDRDKKEQRVLNGMLDTLLRGVGVYGALVSTAKNALIAAHEELGKGYGKKDYSKIMQQLINLSPPIGSKVRKIIGAVKSYDFNKDIIDQMGHGINNPAWNIFTGVVEGVTNAPLDRMRSKLVNVREAIVGDHEMWQRVALFWGWNKWDLGVKDAEIEEARDKVKKQKKKDKKQGSKKIKTWRCRAIKKDGTRCKNEVTTFRNQKCYAHK